MEVRPLRTLEEFRACESLQRTVWGEDFSEVAPASLLKIGQRLGGVSSGAFLPGDGLVGFVFGLTGLEDGEPLHWSHMLAVREGHRGRGIGRRLKEHQRTVLLERSVRRVLWSFDPLVARNAAFNLRVLGVRVTEYVRDMYGRTDSPLHRGLGTDRLVVEWDLTAYDPEADPPPLPSEEARSAPVVGDPDREELPDAPLVRVAVPSDIHDLRDRVPPAAAAWRAGTREAFEHYLAEGYRVSTAWLEEGAERGYYLLERVSAREGREEEREADGSEA